MRRLHIPPHLALDELEQRYRRATDPVAHSHWQIVWLLSGGMPKMVQVTGSSVNWVRAVARRFRTDGPAGIGDRRHGNPGAAPLLDAAQQAQLRDVLAGPAPDRGQWTGREVAMWMSAALRRPVSVKRGWEWLRGLGFNPQRPRPRATQADSGAQDACKKGGLPQPSTA